MTEKQKHYAKFILSAVKEPKNAAGITLLTKTDGQIDAMMDFLEKEKKLSDKKILKKAMEIHRTVK